jgi:hypothetical protein
MAIIRHGYNANWDIDSLVRAAAFKNNQMARDPKRSLSKTLLQRQFWFALKLDLEQENEKRAAGMLNIDAESEDEDIHTINDDDDGDYDDDDDDDDLEIKFEEEEIQSDVASPSSIVVAATATPLSADKPKEESHDLISVLKSGLATCVLQEDQLHLGLTPSDCPPSPAEEESSNDEDEENIEPLIPSAIPMKILFIIPLALS